ncbi:MULTISPECIES: DUF2516 family protein [Corynebacterium]|jgi:ammonia channel protein AmtB|uniref:DUF2516 domain-containing protein n=1 Tax=Corynebacterium provencense TaxID=1737425 RepID=A0A2Z3YLT2_9CORY|nr:MULTISPECIES: DUF2516 family protein [Corynebacterium]AWT25325.1 hypothetical protein Csp1_05060 [Corynebacterium provencense]MCI1255430.1 DUF2516 family protein [Corynebacterium provencense]
MDNPVIYGFQALAILELVIQALVVVLAVVGAVQAAMTREDAFYVIDRKKTNWILALAGSAAGIVLLVPLNVQFIWIIGAVVVGVYWQDVRPSIREVLGNAQ